MEPSVPSTCWPLSSLAAPGPVPTIFGRRGFRLSIRLKTLPCFLDFGLERNDDRDCDNRRCGAGSLNAKRFGEVRPEIWPPPPVSGSPLTPIGGDDVANERG